MNKLLQLGIVLFFTALIFSSCTDDNKEPNDSPNNPGNSVNQWIYDNMIDIYYWYNTINNHTIPENQYPEDYFYSLVYEEEDKWSYITDDFLGLLNDLAGTPISMGYSPTFGRITGTDNVFMIIEYVYPNTPAAKAGLKRGDLILEINDKQLTTDNYIDLFKAEDQKLKFAYISDGVIYPEERTISMSAEQLDINPAIYHNVFTENSVTVGYIVITEFIDDAKFIEYVGIALTELKNSGATELIVDLRYNGGGYINSAQWLASALAPTAIVNNESLLTQLYFNDKMEPTQKPEDKVYLMIENDVNFDLDRVVFLTAYGSASASELVIIGLDPYMNIVQIGENTYGKYTGSTVIYDDSFPPKHNWAMMPIIMKYANAEGYTDFIDGLTPDYYIADELLEGYAFGDVNDPMLAKAIEVCTGHVFAKSADLPVKAYISHEKIFTNKQLIKKNLIIPIENN